MGFFKRLLGKAISPKNKFAHDVIAEFERRGIRPIYYDEARYMLKLPDLGHMVGVEVGLINALHSMANLAPAGRLQAIERFVAGILAPPREYRSLADAADALMPLVRSRATNSIARLQIEDRLTNATDTPTLFAERPLVGDLVVMLGLDLPERISRVSDKALTGMGASFEDALALAMSNLQRRIVPAKFSVEGTSGRGIYCSSSMEDYQSSVLLLPPEIGLSLPPIDGDPVIMCPGRNQVFVTGSANDAGLAELLNIALRSLGSTAHWCSAGLWHWQNDSWTAFQPPAGSPLAALYANTLARERAFFQTEIKFALERRYTARGQDVYVGGPNLLEKDGRIFSTATWTKGVTHGVIPEVDLLGLVDLYLDPKTGRPMPETKTILVPWSKAFAVAGHLLAPLPDVYPPFYEFRSFPEPSQWTSLAA